MLYSDQINIPQIKDNSGKAKKFFLENGFHIERNHFSNNFCENIIDETYSHENFKKGIFKPLMMPHRSSKLIFNSMKEKSLVNFMNLFLGDEDNNVSGLQSEFFFGCPQTQGFSMHQDSFYTEPSIKDSFGSAWIPMVDIEEDMGNLIIYKKSHLLGKLPVRNLNLKKDTNQDPNANNEETDINPDDYEKIKIKEKKGSIVFIHGDLVHSSIKNNSDKFRSVLLLTYIRSNSSFRSGNHAQRQKIPLN